VPFGELPGNIEVEELKDLDFQVGPVRVSAWFANHPGICVGYRIHTDQGSIAFFPDNEPHCRYEPNGSVLPARSDASLEFARAQEEKFIEFVRGVDVLILDAQYDHAEYMRHIGWGHGCVDDVVALAMRSGVKQLFLFHHDPDHDDPKVESMLAHARKLVAAQNSSMQVHAAQEEVLVKLADVACEVAVK